MKLSTVQYFDATVLKTSRTTVNNYWTRLSKISWFVSGEQVTDKSWYFVITQFNSFGHKVCFHISITSWQLREAICHFSVQNVVPITHEQSIICRKTRLDGTPHEQTIICRQLFAGHVVDSRPIERKEKTHRMIIRVSWFWLYIFIVIYIYLHLYLWPLRCRCSAVSTELSSYLGAGDIVSS